VPCLLVDLESGLDASRVFFQKSLGSVREVLYKMVKALRKHGSTPCWKARDTLPLEPISGRGFKKARRASTCWKARHTLPQELISGGGFIGSTQTLPQELKSPPRKAATPVCLSRCVDAL
jgi:hypothetical protein